MTGGMTDGMTAMPMTETAMSQIDRMMERTEAP
jgi:hypothetical protein